MSARFLGGSGLYARHGTLIDGPSGVNVTDIRRRLNTKANGESFGPADRTGPMRGQPVPFAVIGNAPAIVIAVQDPFRKGLLIQNLDPVTDLFVGLGTLADVNQMMVTPRGTILLDFVTVTDAISVFATANVRGFLLTMAPIAT